MIPLLSFDSEMYRRYKSNYAQYLAYFFADARFSPQRRKDAEHHRVFLSVLSASPRLGGEKMLGIKSDYENIFRTPLTFRIRNAKLKLAVTAMIETIANFISGYTITDFMATEIPIKIGA
jgi:hypothetical protein